MGRVIEQTSFEALEPGTYHARLGAVAVEDGDYGEQVVMRWDLLEDGLGNARSRHGRIPS